MSTANDRWKPDDSYMSIRDSGNWRTRNAPQMPCSLSESPPTVPVYQTRKNSFSIGSGKMSGPSLMRSTSVPVNRDHNNHNNSNSNNLSYSKKENGYIEKILHSYGFIQGSDREIRLFFHFSEFKGDKDAMNIGDEVEFRQSSDRRTGKPVAVSVSKKPIVVAAPPPAEIINEKLVSGVVLAEAKVAAGINGTNGVVINGLGRVTYEQSGETFFLAFSLDDVGAGQILQAGDNVEFHISTDEKLGNLRARSVCKLGTGPSSPKSDTANTGVICSLKDNYGFIDRADVVKEIFFHFSEFQGDAEDLNIGDNVQFNIQSRNNKDVAASVLALPMGTVVFEDVKPELYRGKVQKSARQSTHGRQSISESSTGRIVYDTSLGQKEISFTDKDSTTDFTLLNGDIVEFHLATDRRNKVERPTNIVLLEDESFRTSAEIREKGFVTTIKDGYGFIRCVDRDARMFFHFKEKLTAESEIQLQEEVEFTVIEDPSNATRQIAVRIRLLPRGSIPVIDNLVEKLNGTVEKEAGTQLNAESDPGIIMYDVGSTKQTIPYSSAAVDGELPRLREIVEFQISECHSNNTKMAVNVRVCGHGSSSGGGGHLSHSVSYSSQHSVGGGGGHGSSSSSQVKERGWVVTLKESFGFIELADHDREVFFHYSCFEGDPQELDLGDEVEFTVSHTVSHKAARSNAENIRKVTKSIGSSSDEMVLPGLLEGKITRNVRVSNPDQTEYCGMIQVTDIDSEDVFYPYSITSLVDKRDLPQKGDTVRFQIAESRNSNKQRAVRLAPVRRYVHCKVESILGKIVYLDYDLEDTKLSFPLSDLQEAAMWPLGASGPPLAGGVQMSEGDDVELVVVHSLRGVCTAQNVRKICEKPRPERLISRLKSVTDDGVIRVTTMRQPKGPDGTSGFKKERQPSPPSTPSVFVSSSPPVAVFAPPQ